MRRVGSFLVAAALVAGTFSLGAAEMRPAGQRTGKATKAKAQLSAKKLKISTGPKVVGVITYDTGAANGGFHDLSAGGINAGNRFNSAAGQPLLATGVVNSLAFFAQVPGTGSIFFTIFGPPDGGGNGAVLNSLGIMGCPNSAWCSADLAGAGFAQPVGADFLAGIYGEPGSNGALGLDNASVGGQGFHAFQLNTMYANGTFTGFTPIANRNALYRVGGDILTPVELLRFDAE